MSVGGAERQRQPFVVKRLRIFEGGAATGNHYLLAHGNVVAQETKIAIHFLVNSGGE